MPDVGMLERPKNQRTTAGAGTAPRMNGSVEVDADRHSGGSERARERQIEEMARDLADAIERAEADGHEGLRDIAVSLLRERVEAAPPQPVEAGGEPAPFNAFGIGIPLVLMGMVLVFLFPLIGLLLFGVAATMIAWGVGTSLLARR
jgi:hypothetical protein